ncbi:MAG: peptide chain release factor N(5)-glutamine methyltransferase [Clostridia bacterium]|nr:peptide chain release factor N(5)-glutamine methyltransferase [Clostridia bacterium]
MNITVFQALKEGEQQLLLHQVPDARLDAEYLLAGVLNLPRLSLLIEKQKILSREEYAAYRSFLDRRASREPLQYILEEQPFMGYSFRTDKRALIPRNDTEAVCEEALSHIRGRMQVLDLCTGTGAVGIAIKKMRPGCDVTLSDLSREALSLARENAERLQADVRILEGDLFAPVQGDRFHLIVSNPPYIPEGLRGTLQKEVEKEPEMALFAGADGLDFYRRIAREAPLHLHEKGWLVLECGDDQPAAVAALLAQDFEDIRIIRDMNGHDRGISARLKEAAGGKRID